VVFLLFLDNLVLMLMEQIACQGLLPKLVEESLHNLKYLFLMQWTVFFHCFLVFLLKARCKNVIVHLKVAAQLVVFWNRDVGWLWDFLVLWKKHAAQRIPSLDFPAPEGQLLEYRRGDAILGVGVSGSQKRPTHLLGGNGDVGGQVILAGKDGYAPWANWGKVGGVELEDMRPSHLMLAHLTYASLLFEGFK